jgi:RND family efflux transporter MFP subunit
MEALERAAAPSADRASDVRLAQLALDRAKDDLARAQVDEERLSRSDAGAQVRVGLTDPTAAIRAAERRVADATLRLEQAQTALAQAQTARDTRQELAALDLTARRAELASALAKLSEMSSGPAADQIAREEKRAAFLLEQLDAAREAARPEVTLTAPFDGVVVSILTTVGQTIAARAPAMRITADSELTVIANASEFDVPHLNTDQQIGVRFPGLVGGAATGVIVDVSGVATPDEMGRSIYPVRIDLRTPPSGLKVGMTAEIDVTLREARDVLYLPSNALRTINGSTSVTRVADDGTVSDVPVEVGNTYSGNVEVLGGLNEGDLVAVYSQTTAASRP